MDTTVKIEADNHDILVLKFNCFIKPETMAKTVEEIIKEYKTGLIFIPAYMDVYVVKSNKEVTNGDNSEDN